MPYGNRQLFQCIGVWFLAGIRFCCGIRLRIDRGISPGRHRSPVTSPLGRSREPSSQSAGFAGFVVGERDRVDLVFPRPPGMGLR